MARRIFQLVAGMVLVLAVFTPLAECFDHWDGKSTVPANDTELRLTVLFAGAGALLTLAQLLRYVPVLVGRASRSYRFAATNALPHEATREGPMPTVSPPLISLRI